MMGKAVKNSVTQGQYFYDGEGKRVKVVETNTRVFTFLGLSIIQEKDVTANVVSKYFYANGLMVARVNPFATTYFHQDVLGSTRLTTDGFKAVQFSSNYKPFGPGYGASGPNATSEKVKYTGKFEDLNTKLYYFGARYLDPDIGRFTTQDPILSINQYVYANNNPLKFTDPTGLFAEDYDTWYDWYDYYEIFVWVSDTPTPPAPVTPDPPQNTWDDIFNDNDPGDISLTDIIQIREQIEASTSTEPKQLTMSDVQQTINTVANTNGESPSEPTASSGRSTSQPVTQSIYDVTERLVREMIGTVVEGVLDTVKDEQESKVPGGPRTFGMEDFYQPALAAGVVITLFIFPPVAVGTFVALYLSNKWEEDIERRTGRSPFPHPGYP